MGGRGTFASGNNVAYSYETVGKIEGVKVLQKLDKNASGGLPEEAHSSGAYIMLNKDGNFKNEKLENLIKNEINTNIVNKPNLRMFEKVKKFELLKDSFSVENGTMSMTQKIKRNKVFEKYKDLIGGMYK